jgi:hypothetical protein
MVFGPFTGTARDALTVSPGELSMMMSGKVRRVMDRLDRSQNFSDLW